MNELDIQLIEATEKSVLQNINQSFAEFMLFAIKQLEKIKDLIQPLVQQPLGKLFSKLKEIMGKLKNAKTIEKTFAALVLFSATVVGLFSAFDSEGSAGEKAKQIIIGLGARIAGIIDWISVKFGFEKGDSVKKIVEAAETAKMFVIVFFDKATTPISWLIEGFKSKIPVKKNWFQRLFEAETTLVDSFKTGLKIVLSALASIVVVVLKIIIGVIIGLGLVAGLDNIEKSLKFLIDSVSKQAKKLFKK